MAGTPESGLPGKLPVDGVDADLLAEVVAQTKKRSNDHGGTEQVDEQEPAKGHTQDAGRQIDGRTKAHQESGKQVQF